MSADGRQKWTVRLQGTPPAAVSFRLATVSDSVQTARLILFDFSPPSTAEPRQMPFFYIIFTSFLLRLLVSASMLLTSLCLGRCFRFVYIYALLLCFYVAAVSLVPFLGE